MALISQTEIEYRLGRGLSSDEQSDFSLLNSANQSYVEKMINSKLETAEETTRYYDGGKQHIPIDPCTDITSVKYVDEDFNTTETIDTSYYEEEPINQTLKTYLRNRYGRFVNGVNTIAVTAKFSIAGDSDMQAVIKDMLLNVLVSQLSDTKNKKRESIEGYSVEFASDDVKSQLNKIGALFQVMI